MSVQDFSSVDAEEWFDRGNSLLEEGRYEEAIASYDKALEHKPDFHEAWYNRGSFLSYLGRSEEAIANYQQGLSYLQSSK
jgi:tetratricopeptide (TPR) repeat protein